MAIRIDQILHRRTDLSTFLVHLTRSHNGMSARERLEAIIEEGELTAATPMGWAANQDDAESPAAQSQRVVCFSEAPLEQAWTFATDIEGRQVQLGVTTITSGKVRICRYFRLRQPF